MTTLSPGDIHSYVHRVGRDARAASRAIALADAATKNRALGAIAGAIRRESATILIANETTARVDTGWYSV